MNRGLLALTALAFAALRFWPLALVFLVLTWFSGHFFRDPERVVPSEDDIAVSPADGRVIRVEPKADPITGEVRPCISIFMNVFNVHVNRSPVAGRVEAIRYFPGKFFNAALDKASTDNERCAYLVRDEKTVLFDTVDSAVRTTFRENVAHVLNGRAPDYLVVHHMEPDHAAEMADLARQYPDMAILCSAAAKNMIAQFFDAELAGRVTVVKEGDTLCTGRHTLRFIAAPMVHWPEVLMTYDETDKLLLSADAFGSFGALNGTLFADEVDFDREVLDEARRYYTNIVGKYGAQVQAVLQKAAGLDIRMLLPLHGHVWRQDLGYILGKYDLWSRWEPEVRGVMIAYASVYGNTENAANILACRLVEQGVKVKMYDVSVTPSSYVVSDAFKYSHLVFAAPTYNGGVFITMDEVLRDIASHGLQNRGFALLENGTWAPVTARQMAALLEPLKGWRQVGESVTVRSAAHAPQLAAIEGLAAALIADISGEKQ